MAKIQIKYDPSPTQERFHQSRHEKILLLGGKGSGKTYSLVNKGLQLAGMNKGVDGGILCPTLKMFKRDVLPTFKKICKESKIPYSFNKSEYEFYFPLSDNKAYVFHAEDDGESIAGPNLGWGIINEVTLTSFLAYAEFVARIREKRAKKLQCAMSGTPEDLAWVHEELLGKDSIDTMFISTRENQYISPSYVRSLENTYDAKRQQAYIDGKPVIFTGNRAGWSFDRARHHKILDFDPKEIWVSVDFNVAPMGSTIWFIPGLDQKFNAYARTEVNIPEDATTEKWCVALKEKLLELGVSGKKISIYPDPAGKARGTRSSFSDIQIIENHGFTDVRFKKKIVSIKDCLNSLNNLFDKDRFLVHPECYQLTTDLERCKIKEGSFEIDKSDSKRSHWIDGAKDMADYEFPIINPNVKVSVS